MPKFQHLNYERDCPSELVYNDYLKIKDIRQGSAPAAISGFT